MGTIITYVTIRSKKQSPNLTKKNARRGRSGIEKFSLDQLANCGSVETAVADLVQLDPDTAMSLSPASLVTMMTLSGTGDSVAGYAAYALNRLGDAYEEMGQSELAAMRKEQAVAIAEAFGADLNEIPEELRELEAELQA